jgi:hypothetical protein
MISENNRPELFAAISKMQSELTGAFKGSKGHGYSYSDLYQCIKTAQEPLANNGLAVVQLLNETDKGTEIETVLTHEAGGYMASSFLMAHAVLMGGGGKNPAQSMGASISYMRRYSYCAMIGLAQTDDDAANVREQKITATDQQWIDAVKANPEVLSQIENEQYRLKIQSLIK